MYDLLGRKFELGSYFIYINSWNRKALGRVIKITYKYDLTDNQIELFTANIVGTETKVAFNRLDKTVIISDQMAILMFEDLF